MHSAMDLKEEICARSNTRKQATVEGLWKVLNDMQRKGIRSFTIAQVGRCAEDAGVLRTQSLRNAGGEDYRALIDAFALEIGVATTSLPTTKPTPLEEAIDAIPDLDVRTRLRMILVENGRQREEIGRLRQAFKHIHPAAKDNGAQVPEILASPATNVDMAPIEKFLSPAWVDERRWTVDPNGAIYSEDGECLAPVGFAKSLKGLPS